MFKKSLNINTRILVVIINIEILLTISNLLSGFNKTLHSGHLKEVENALMTRSSNGTFLNKNFVEHSGHFIFSPLVTQLIKSKKLYC